MQAIIGWQRRLNFLVGPDSPVHDPWSREVAVMDVRKRLAAAQRAWQSLRRPKHKRVPAAQHRSVLLNIKGVIDDGRREFEGWASTVELDAMGDVLVPEGATWGRLPMPCLFQHDHRSPVGEILHIEARPSGLWVHGRIDKDDRPGPLATLLDQCWGFVRRRLIRSLSVGFQALASEPLASGGKRYTKWRVYEISLVSCAANPAATIEMVRALPRVPRAA
jgi:HK97 family phage prohead protease